MELNAASVLSPMARGLLLRKGSPAREGVIHRPSTTTAALARAVTVCFGAGNQFVIVILTKNDV
jgi:hypothetical protein